MIIIDRFGGNSPQTDGSIGWIVSLRHAGPRFWTFVGLTRREFPRLAAETAEGQRGSFIVSCISMVVRYAAETSMPSNEARVAFRGLLFSGSASALGT